MDKKINIGIIGCGWIAQRAHLPAYKKIKNVNILSIFDINHERAENIAKKFNVPLFFNNFDSFIETNLDAVVITTPNNTHKEYIIESLKRKKHVLCEKPICLKSSEILQILKINENNQCVFMPGFVNRFREDVQGVNNLINDEIVGDVNKIEACWIRRHGLPRPGSWFTNKKLSGGGVLVDLGSHMIDIATFFLKSKKTTDFYLKTWYTINNKDYSGASWFHRDEENKFNIDVEDTAVLNINFENNKIINLKLSWKCNIKNDVTYFRVFGSKGTLELKTLFGFSSDRLWLDDEIVITPYKGIPYIIKIDKTKNNMETAFQKMSNHFVQCIIGDQTEYLTSTDASLNVSIIENLYANESIISNMDKNVLLESDKFGK